MFTKWIENFGASITVMDLDGKILDMNTSAGKVFEKWGGKNLIGTNLKGCHQQKSKDIMKDLMTNDKTNVYTIKKNETKKLIYQAPWYNEKGKVAGLVEISMIIPVDMPHFDRG